MRIVCLIQPKPPLIYFANAVHRRHKIDLAVIETPPASAGLTDRLRRKGVMGSLAAIRSRLKGRAALERTVSEYKRFFDDSWEALDDDIATLEVESINEERVRERLSAQAPEVILDHGTSIVKDHILETAPLALNVHWGLSPYYRGTACTEWALINWDPYNIGVTIHKLAREIDGGDIVAQKRAVLSGSDTVNSINMQLTALGTELMLDIITRLEAGEKLSFRQQDYGKGFVTYNRHWSRHLSAHIDDIEEKGIIKRMLKRPARKERLPIIEL